MEVISANGVEIAIIDHSVKIESTQDMLDLMVSTQYETQCSRMIIAKESLPEHFFDLKSGFAGDLLQKFSNYRMKLAIVGDFSSYASKSLRDFIRECNRGNQIYFKEDFASAANALSISSL